MSWFRKYLGMDFVDVAIQTVLTGLAMGFADTIGHGPPGEALMFMVPAASIVIFGWRRQRGLARLANDPSVGLTTGQMAAARIEDLEARVAMLEAVETRLIEVEERLDFTERMLAQGTGERAALGNGERK